jgi:hypothetical protein
MPFSRKWPYMRFMKGTMSSVFFGYARLPVSTQKKKKKKKKARARARARGRRQKGEDTTIKLHAYP